MVILFVVLFVVVGIGVDCVVVIDWLFFEDFG